MGRWQPPRLCLHDVYGWVSTHHALLRNEPQQGICQYVTWPAICIPTHMSHPSAHVVHHKIRKTPCPTARRGRQLSCLTLPENQLLASEEPADQARLSWARFRQVQQAVLLNRQVLTKGRQAVPYARLASPAAANGHAQAVKLLGRQPELVHLERCLRTHLSMHHGGSSETPAGWQDTLPHAIGHTVRMLFCY